MSQEIDQKIALDIQRNMMGYLQYENQTFHIRNGFYMTINIFIFGIAINLFIKIVENNYAYILYAPLFILCFIGYYLSVMWFKTLIHVRDVWINKWISKLKEIEIYALKNIEFFRDIHPLNNIKTHGSVQMLVDIAKYSKFFWVLMFILIVMNFLFTIK
jgi:hypothetical protein